MEARIMVEDLLNFTLDVGEEDYHYDENTLKAPSSTTSNSQDPDDPVSFPAPQFLFISSFGQAANSVRVCA